MVGKSGESHYPYKDVSRLAAIQYHKDGTIGPSLKILFTNVALNPVI